MRLPRNHLHLPGESGRDRRRHGRLRCDDTTCALGEIFDLSASGMRVERRGRAVGAEGDCFVVRLSYGDAFVLVKCRIVRLTRVGFRKYSYGLEFVEVTAETAQSLGQFARAAAERKLFASTVE